MDQVGRFLGHDPSEFPQASDGPSREETDVGARRDHLRLDTVGPMIQARDDGLDPGILERREELGERAFGASRAEAVDHEEDLHPVGRMCSPQSSEPVDRGVQTAQDDPESVERRIAVHPESRDVERVRGVRRD